MITIAVKFEEILEQDTLIMAEKCADLAAEHAKAFAEWVCFGKKELFFHDTTELYQEWLTQLGYE